MFILKNHTLSPLGPFGPRAPGGPTGPWKLKRKYCINTVILLFFSKADCNYSKCSNPPSYFFRINTFSKATIKALKERELYFRYSIAFVVNFEDGDVTSIVLFSSFLTLNDPGTFLCWVLNIFLLAVVYEDPLYIYKSLVVTVF